MELDHADMVTLLASGNTLYFTICAHYTVIRHRASGTWGVVARAAERFLYMAFVS